MIRKLKLFVVGLFVSLTAAVSAIADEPEAFFEVPTVDAALLGTMVTAILAALALIWVVRKAIKMINRS